MMIERDFLGLMSSSSKNGCIDHVGSAGMQWGVSNSEVSSLSPQFMPFKPIQKEGPIKASSSAFHSYRSTQKTFNLDRQSAHFSMPPHQVHAIGLNEVRTFPVSTHSIPELKSNPLIKIHGGVTSTNSAPFSVKQLPQQQPLAGVPVTHETFSSIMGSFAGTYAPRSISKTTPPTAQLTIFYGGVVNVFDEVSLEKAQAIMFLAGNGSSMAANGANPIAPEAQAMSPKPLVVDGVVHVNQSHATSPHSCLSSPTSVTSHMGAQSGSGSSNSDELVGAKALEAALPPQKAIITSMESAAIPPICKSSFPIARNASLVRFFEKRKERLTNASPYTIKSPECGLASGRYSKASTSFPQSWCP